MPGSSASSKKPLWIIIAGFSVALFANVALIYFAINSWTGLETEHPYAKGLAYNSNLEGAKRQRALGWQVQLRTEFTPGKALAGTSEVSISDKGGRPLDDLDVRIIATRPTREGYDREFSLAAVGGGVFRGGFALPLKGQWDFRILARRGGDDFQRVERIVTP